MRSALARSDHGLDSPRDDWMAALCRDHPDLWFPRSWEGKARAAHVCGHCPVLAQCAADLRSIPDTRLHGAVVAGVAHNDAGAPVRWPLPHARCHRCWKPSKPPSVEARLRAVTDGP